MSKAIADKRLLSIPEVSDLRRICDQIPDMIYVKDLEGRFLFANEAIVSNNGLSRLEDLVGRTDFDFLPQDVAQMVADVERQVAQTGQPHFGCEELAFLGDDERWLMISRVPFRDGLGTVIGVIGISRDITAQKVAGRLKDAQATLLELIARGASLSDFLAEVAKTAAHLADGIGLSFVVRPPDDEGQGAVLSQSLTSEQCLAIGKAAQNADWTDIDAVSEKVLKTVAGPTLFQREALKLLPIQSEGRVEGLMIIRSSQGLAGRPDPEIISIAANLAGVAIARDRTDARINFLAEHDPLTGMANRTLLEKQLKASIQAANFSEKAVTVAFLDLDNFKLVNDSLGHSAGDELLKIVAGRVRALIADRGSVARVGGDEFVIVLPQMTAEDSFCLLSEIRDAVNSPISVNDAKLRVTCSIGVAAYPAHANLAEDLLAAADMAMYRAKDSGRDAVAVFDLEMATAARTRLSRIEELRQAIDRNEFVLHFQPQIDARSGRVVGAEALVRWQHPVDGLRYPANFVPLAEETGQISEIGEWVLLEACRKAKAWREMGLQPIRISVNVSARQFQEKRLIETVKEALAQYALEPRLLELEITESLIMKDLQGSILMMHELTALGVTLAIDDFGTGYSSLSALKKFPLSRLKIDRSFISELPNSSEDSAITSAIISMAQSLGIDVIAEGVETMEQALFLIEAGCSDVQGYVFSRPIPADEFAAFVRRAPTSRVPAGPA